MKRIYIISLLSIGLAMYACGGSSSKTADQQAGGETTDNTAATAAIDVNKPSDSKGVGIVDNVDVPETIDQEMAAKGQEIFQTKCTVCHQPTDQKLIGPGLKGITQIRTPEWIMNMITNPDKMLEEDPVAKALLAEYNGVRMTNQGVTKEEARQLLEFLRQNDAQ